MRNLFPFLLTIKQITCNKNHLHDKVSVKNNVSVANRASEKNKFIQQSEGTHIREWRKWSKVKEILQNTLLKCKSLLTVPSVYKLVALAQSGCYLWAKSLKNKKPSLCLNLPTDRGLWRPPTELGTELWSRLKTLLYGTKWKQRKKFFFSLLIHGLGVFCL